VTLKFFNILIIKQNILSMRWRGQGCIDAVRGIYASTIRRGAIGLLTLR
jgi:hypothetical protein